MNGKSKKELINDRSITHQQGLVEALLGSGTAPLKRAIPGGKTMLQTLDKENMSRAVYNWLRGCGGFTEVTISFAKDPSKFNPSATTVSSFPGDEQKPFWDKADGRKELADQLASIISTQKIVYVTAKPNGIVVGTDTTKKFAPLVTVTEALIKDYPEFVGMVGKKVPSPDWEPYIEFKPANKSRYTSYQK